MNNKSRKSRKLNFNLTRKVIELEDKGYCLDYMVLKGQLLCVQNNQSIPVEAVHICVVDQGYDQLSSCFKYIHTVDTGNGEKGVMITDAIITNNATSLAANKKIHH
ncbi:hypothetical protein [Mucilaginibacter sp.]|uniref:hypothetical protein n=1 Tax=Mucilaginibacter sp. TaxID=1882438 RepID=UPI0035BC2414